MQFNQRRHALGVRVKVLLPIPRVEYHRTCCTRWNDAIWFNWHMKLSVVEVINWDADYVAVGTLSKIETENAWTEQWRHPLRYQSHWMSLVITTVSPTAPCHHQSCSLSPKHHQPNEQMMVLMWSKIKPTALQKPSNRTAVYSASAAPAPTHLLTNKWLIRKPSGYRGAHSVMACRRPTQLSHNAWGTVHIYALAQAPLRCHLAKENWAI